MWASRLLAFTCGVMHHTATKWPNVIPPADYKTLAGQDLFVKSLASPFEWSVQFHQTWLARFGRCTVFHLDEWARTVVLLLSRFSVDTHSLYPWRSLDPPQSFIWSLFCWAPPKQFPDLYRLLGVFMNHQTRFKMYKALALSHRYMDTCTEALLSYIM